MGVRYGKVVDWTRGELLDRMTRKILTCNGLFDPRANVAMRRRKRIKSAKDCILSKSNELWDYLEKSEEPMLKEVVKENFMMEKERKKEYESRTKERNKTSWKERSLHRKLPKPAVDFADSASWQWLRSGYVKKTHKKLTRLLKIKH